MLRHTDDCDEDGGAVQLSFVMNKLRHEERERH